jgi:hypothetical protein
MQGGHSLNSQVRQTSRGVDGLQLNMTTTIGTRVSQAIARQLQAEDGIAGLVIAYADCSSAKDHRAVIAVIQADASRLSEAKLTKKTALVLRIEGKTYVRHFAVDAQDSKGDVSENSRFGTSRARFSLVSVKSLASKAGAKLTVCSKADAQKWLDGEGAKLNSCERSRGVFHNAQDGVRVAFDDAKAAGLKVGKAKE